ncbi:MAG: FAD-dependent oxidoreductase [Armatimonadota bacterium]
MLRRQKNVRFVMAEATAIHADQRRVEAGGHMYSYDTLVIAVGVQYNYFGHEEWREVAPSLKTIADAEEILRRVLTAFERAESEPDPALRRADLTYLLVGGGPTGVEMAGALAELLKETLGRELTQVKSQEVRILLVEAAERILTQFPEDLANASAARLKQLGVEIITGKHVTEIDAEGVMIGEEPIATKTVIWTAGVKGVPLLATLGVPLDKAGRIPVNAQLEVEGLPGVYVVGDAASITGPDGKPLPGVAQVAMQGGDYVGAAIRASIAGRELGKPFHYWDKGNLAVVGRSFAIADLHRYRFRGFFAWILWLFIHILYLSTFRARFFVFLRWTSAFLFKDRSAIVFDTPVVPAKVQS